MVKIRKQKKFKSKYRKTNKDAINEKKKMS